MNTSMQTMAVRTKLQVSLPLSFLRARKKKGVASVTVIRKENTYCFHPEKQSSS